MSLAPAHAPDRVVLLTRSLDVRGTAAEFRHIGAAVASHDDFLHALRDVAHDPEAIFIVASDFDGCALRDLLDLVLAMNGPSVVLGLGHGDVTDAVRVAFDAGVRATVELPLTPERLLELMRRLPAGLEDEEPVTVGNLTVDPGRHEVLWHGTPVEVTLREFAILYALTKAHPRLATLQQLADEYGGTSADPNAAIRVAIKRIRTRLAAASAVADPAIETVRGIGYRLAC